MNREYFVGEYIHDMSNLFVASLVSGQHCVSIGAPGWGKTDVAISLLGDVLPQRHALVRLNEASQPEVIQGATDMEVLLKESKFRLNTAGTPYDAQFEAVMLDEAGRGNDEIYSLLMFLLDRKDFAFPHPVLCTANFLPSGKKHEALLDRIGLWGWVVPGALDARAMAAAQMSRNESDLMLKVPGRLPTRDELQMCYSAVPGPDAIGAVCDTIEMAAAEALAIGRPLHPRRINQWQRLLFRMGVYATGGDCNFKVTPPEAIAALKFAWPAPTIEEYIAWAEVVASLHDPVQSGVDEILNQAATVVNEAACKQVPPAERGVYTERLMQYAASLADLEKEYPDDDRPKAASQQIGAWFYKIARGEKVDRA